MKLIQHFPFKDSRLELSATERAALLRAAEIAEKAASYYERESPSWTEWMLLATNARDAVSAECVVGT